MASQQTNQALQTPAIVADKPISEQDANDILMRSQIKGTISELGTLARSLLFAELSMITYLSEEQVKKAVLPLNFTEVHYYEKDGAQAYSFISEHDHVIACRGTEPNEWNDVKADMDAATAVAETIGRVHRGFKREVDDLWPILEESLHCNCRTLWFTGHSLGGAMATICAGRCLLSHIPTEPKQIYTFGSPRVGDKRYINHAKVDYLRWVNNNDIVTRVPPVWLGYRHTGQEMYLDAAGQLKRLNLVQKGADRWQGFLQGIRKHEIDHFTDHRIDRYVEYIYQEALKAGEISE